MNNTVFDTLIIVTASDFLRLKDNYQQLIKCMPGQDIIFVGSLELKNAVSEADLGTRAKWLNENEIIPFDQVHQTISNRMSELLKGNELPRGITGWYYQQFLKMQYARICQNRYYMVWDGDTLPCKEFDVFTEEGKSFIDVKSEYHKPYFDTMARLIPYLSKCIDRSFIAEHMMFECFIMKELLDENENNSELDGNAFWEKIINAISVEGLQTNSFSEFETYGTYATLKHPDCAVIRHWRSFRYGGYFFRPQDISESDYEWLARDFHAISFEKGQDVREDLDGTMNNPYYQNKLTARQMLEIAQEDFEEGSFIETWD